jgi:NADPH-dependent F420 reductase
MKIGILGTGNMGNGLARGWAAKGHQIMFGSRNPDTMKTMAGFNLNVNSGSVADAARFGSVILLAVPWTAVQDTLRNAGPLEGKIIIDCTNPIGHDYHLAFGFNTSAAEEIALMAPSAHVVKAFNTIASAVLSRPSFGLQPATVFYCGNNAGAKKVVAELITDLGFEAVDAGALKNARYVEAMAVLFIQLAYKQGFGADMAFKLLRRT